MKHLKKIAFVIESLDCGGAEKSLVTLLQNLDYTRMQVDLLLLSPGGAFEKMVPAPVSIKYISLNPNNKLQLLWKRTRYYYERRFGNPKQHGAQKFWKVFGSQVPVWQDAYDVAISYSQGFCTYYVASKMHADKKYTWLNTDYIKAGYDAGYDWAHYRQYHKIVTVSEEGDKIFHKAMASFSPALSTITIKDISDRAIIRAQSTEPITEHFDKEQINIVTVCRLEPPKGLQLAVETCKQLRDQGFPVHWYIVGEGSERKGLEQLIAQYRLQDYFTLLGYRDNPYPYIRQSDIYVQTSLYEGWGLTLIEATLLEKPVVTTNFPTAHQIIRNGVNGYIVSMNSEELSEKIGYLIMNRAVAALMARQQNHFSEENKIRSLQDFYRLLEG